MLERHQGKLTRRGRAWPKGVFGFLSSSFSDQRWPLFSGLACFAFLKVRESIRSGGRGGNVSVFLDPHILYVESVPPLCMLAVDLLLKL